MMGINGEVAKEQKVVAGLGFPVKKLGSPKNGVDLDERSAVVKPT
jgi:hypothetical protein